MILKGSQRGNGSDLAVHLMNGFDNEKIEVAEVYGTIAGVHSFPTRRSSDHRKSVV